MRTLANILWHIPFCGFISAFCFFLLGGFLTITIVAAPIGLGLIQYSKFLLLPFKYEMISKDDLGVQQNKAWKLYGSILKIFYVIFFGIPASIFLILEIVGLTITVVGIPCAIVLAKSLGTVFQPVNKICVDRLVAGEVRQRNASTKTDGIYVSK